MRVIAGDAHGHALKVPKVSGLRPTSDLVRGAIFDMVGPYFPAGTRVLDLYAGTGALGIEALSRGADWADFVEQHPRCCHAIKENLDHTALMDRAKVHCQAVQQALLQLSGPYSLVLMDPPYARPVDSTILQALVRLELMLGESILVLEHAHRLPLPPEHNGLRLIKQRRHGDTTISLFETEGAGVG